MGQFANVRADIGAKRHGVNSRFPNGGYTMTPQEWKAALLKIAPQGKPWIIDGFADALPAICEKFDITTTNRQAHFIAQCAHECDHFKTTQEYASGAAYEGRKDLGNTKSGDGKRYKGRGLIQLTGRANYAAASKALGVDYIANPELVERFPAAADVSAWFWDTHKLNQHADRDDVRAVTKVINGGYNGLDSRTALLSRAKIVFA
jgi:putative chitinase